MDSRIFRLGVGSALGTLAVATRLLPHPANFTAVGAVTLVASYALGWRWAAGVTMAAMFSSDLFLGFYHLPVMLSVYGSLLVAAGIGRWVRRDLGVSWPRVVGGSFAASVLFYLVTNFAVWRFTLLYPKTGVGLTAAYVAALPFFRNSLVGDLFYAGALFGALEAARWWRAKSRAFSLLSFTLPAAAKPSPLVGEGWERGK